MHGHRRGNHGRSDPVDPTTLPYRRGVGMMLVNRADQVFVARRLDTPSEAWQMPQGGIDEGEQPREACLRELEEEIGTSNADILAETADWFHYDLPAYLVPRVWGGRYRGQMQKWFCLRFRGEDRDINIATEHPEFTEWRWVPVDMLPSVIVPFKRDIYTRVVAEFRPIILGAAS